jgi:hypothetical protein
MHRTLLAKEEINKRKRGKRGATQTFMYRVYL